MEKTKKYMSANTIPHHQNSTEYSYSNHEVKFQMQWLINELQNPKVPHQTQCMSHYYTETVVDTEACFSM